MPRIRSLKPELWLSPQIMNLSRDGRLLFIGLITQADDEGRGTADPRKLKASIFPGDDDITAARIRELQAEIEAQALGVFYDGNGHGGLYCLLGFTTHQSINKPTASRYPPPPGGVANSHSRNGTGGLPAHSGSTPEGSEGSDRKDLKGSDLTRARATPVDNGDNSARSARRPGRSKKTSDPEEIERKRRQAGEIAASLAARKVIP